MAEVIGKIKWYAKSKGFGFIKSEGVDGDIFIHHSRIVAGKTQYIPQDGDTVKFEMILTPKGYLADKLRKHAK